MLGALLKAARGVCSLDELLELLSAMGVDAELRPADPAGAAEALEAALQGGAVPYLLDGAMKDGQRILAVLVLPAGGAS